MSKRTGMSEGAIVMTARRHGKRASMLLMAAAPELLAALERIFELADYACSSQEIRQIANDAIRKAKGVT
jgi:hypothetical protein